MQTKQSTSSDAVLFVVGAYGIGKERVYMALAQMLGIKVHVDKTRWKTMLCYDWPKEELARLTTESVKPISLPVNINGICEYGITKAAILVLPINQINFKSLSKLMDTINNSTISHDGKLAKTAKFTSIVAFQPTG